MIKLSDYVIKYFADQGIKHLFLLPGGGCMHLVDSLGLNKKIAPVAFLHEQGAVIAADGYAQYRNDLGVSLVTTGPGGTNAVTGVAAAWIDSTSLLVISGQVKRKDLLVGKGLRQMGIQEVDIISIVKPITKYAVTILDPKTIRYHLEKAVYLAKNGRPGPVWLDLPLDVQGTMVDQDKLPGFKPETEGLTKGEKLSPKVVEKVIKLLNQAKRPVILAGRGIRLAHAEEAFLKVISQLKIPVLTTWRMADSLPEDSQFYIGRPGSIASRGANYALQNADLILIIGARLDLPQVGHSYDNFAKGATKVIVDIDANEIKKLGKSFTCPVVADAKIFLAEFLKQIKSVKVQNLFAWSKKCHDWKAKYPLVLKADLKLTKAVNTYALVETLSELMSERDLLVPGSSGSCAEITLQAFKVKNGQRIINSPGLGSMGFGLPQSLGICLASGRRRTVCIVGDGGLQHNIQELETLRRLNLPIKVFVLNNNGYASIRNTHKRFFDGRLVCCDPSSGLTLPDTCKVAAAYGLKTTRIANQSSLKKEVQKVLNQSGPVICDVMIDPDLQTAPRLSSKAQPDGTMVSSPLEDLWPFLDRAEFEQNMLKDK